MILNVFLNNHDLNVDESVLTNPRRVGYGGLIRKHDGSRDVYSAVWFSFKVKSYLNCNIKKHAVWFGSVDF